MLRKDLRRDSGPGTADAAEIARFDALADEWWKADGAFKTIHDFNRVRVGYLREHLPKLLQRDPAAPSPLRGLKIIDVGCAAGIVTENLAPLGAEILGIDAAGRNIAIARRHADASGSGVEYRQALPEDLAAHAASFDVVLSLEVVEHVADQRAFVAAIAGLVKPDGILVIGTLNRTLRSFVKAIIGAEYILRWLPRGTHDWRKFVKPRELDVQLHEHGFALEAQTGVSLDVLRGRWETVADDSVTYLRLYRRTTAPPSA